MTRRLDNDVPKRPVTDWQQLISDGIAGGLSEAQHKLERATNVVIAAAIFMAMCAALGLACVIASNLHG